MPPSVRARNQSPSWVFVVTACVLASCSGSRGSFERNVYRDDGIAFEVPAVPSTWNRLDVPRASLAFRDGTQNASILINARCGRKIDNVPLPALVNQLLIGTTERNISLEETIPMDSRESRHVHLTAKLDGVPRAYDVIVLKKDGCVYDFVAVTEPDSFAAVSPAFEQFARGFHTLGPGESSKNGSL